ncbi:MAG: thermonuclease family protein [Candidatus Poribacteria bacterium]|nr:thermonuclease family protein [Candidatus Poribacteria bacterium]
MKLDRTLLSHIASFRRVVLTLLLCLSLAGCGTSDVLFPESSAPIYYGTIDSIDAVYDGDTIRDVAILIYPFYSPTPGMSEAQLTLWPGIERRADGIYSITDIRIAGIDTPEKRPIRGDRTEASIQREKARAEAATDFLKRLLLDNSKADGTLGFVIQNPELDKYAGRIVADVICFKDGVSIDVAEVLLEAGHAVVYDGGTKTHDWGAE